MRKWFTVALLAPLFSNCQQLSLNGNVQNESGEPVAGATITVRRADASATARYSSGANGAFRLTGLHIGDSLLFTAVGYRPTAQVFDRVLAEHNQLTVLMVTKATALEEVVVNTGYQRLPKERSTGSFSVINKAALDLQVGTNIIARLEGMANGLLFDRQSGHPSLTVRGISTLYGNKAPLVVLDNFPYEGDVANINPADVESITVLKDAAAASIWGTRAGNGVIVITTKRGRFNTPLTTEFTAGFTTRSAPDLSYLPEMSSGDFIDAESFLFSKGFYTAQEALNTRPVLSPVVEALIAQRDGKITAADAAQKIDALRGQSLRDDFSRYLYRSSSLQQYALSIRGGTANLGYSAGIGFDKAVSELEAPYNRVTLRFENTWKPAKGLQVTTALSVVKTESASGRPAYGSVTVNGKRLYPYAQIADAAGNAVPVYAYRQTYTDTAGAGRLLDWKLYPLTDYEYNTTKTSVVSNLATLGLTYNPVTGLTVEARAQYQSEAQTGKTIQDLGGFAARDLVNRFSQLNRATGVVKYGVPLGAILIENVGKTEALNGRLQMAYSTVINQHAFTALAGAEAREIKGTSSAYRTYGYNGNLLTSAVVDLVNSYPTFITGSSATIPSGTAYTEKINRFTSLFANLAYTYYGKYTVSASARKDASNLFGVKSNEKGVPLWSAGLAWDLSREGWYKWKALPYLKLRATYGFNGNVDNTRSAVNTLSYFSGTATYTNLPYANVSQFANPELRWERVKVVNLGLDFNSPGSRFAGSIEYYQKWGLDLFGQTPVDLTTGLGATTITKNVADTKAKGWDVELTVKTVEGKWGLTQSLIFNYNLARVMAYYVPGTQGSNYISSGATVTPLPGQPVYSIISYKWAGLDGATGDPVGYVAGQPSSIYADITGAKTALSDLVYSGSAVPACFGSFGNTLTWKRFSLTANILFKLGYVFRRTSINYSNLFNLWQGHSDYALRWQKPGDEQTTNVPSLVYPAASLRDGFYNAAEVLVTKGDHIRLQFINLAYAITPKTHSFFRGISLYLNASDLGLLWRQNRYGLDPDYPATPPPARAISTLR